MTSFVATPPAHRQSNSMASRIVSIVHPKVGVGVVILRHLREHLRPEVLLIQRGKPPSKGQWSFCGGSLELGETMIDCAIREAREETGLALRHQSELIQSPGTVIFYPDLRHPTVFTAVDVIDEDEESGNLRFHYAVVEVAAVPEDPRVVPQAGDDADLAQWVDVEALRSMSGLVPRAIEVVDEALARFQIPIE